MSIIRKMTLQDIDAVRQVEAAGFSAWWKQLKGEAAVLPTRTRPNVLSCFAKGAEGSFVAEQAIRAEDVALVAKHAFAVAQAFHSYYQKPKYSVLHAETEDLRAGRTLVVDTFVRQVETLLGLLGIPVPERM